MTSKIKVNILADGGDNAIITSDGAGSFTASSGLASSVQSVGGIQMTPAFSAYLSANQSLTSNAFSVIQMNTEHFDSDGCYDTATYRFTPNQAGWYFLHTEADINAGANSQHYDGGVNINKNGSEIYASFSNYAASYPKRIPYQTSGIAYANGTTDYFTTSCYVYAPAGTPSIDATSGRVTRWCGFKIIGA